MPLPLVLFRRSYIMPETLMRCDTTMLPPEPSDTEIVSPSDARSGLISANFARVSGTPCFAGTRVPIRNLWDYLQGGDNIADFLDGFPSVSEEQVRAVLTLACQKMLEGLPPDTCHG